MTIHLSYGTGLFHSMGLGKSYTIINTAEILYLNGYIRHVYVIVPLSIVPTWVEQLELHTCHSTWQAVVGTADQKRKKLQNIEGVANKLRWYVLNCEGLSNVHTELKKRRPHMCVVDEATLMRDRNSNRSKLIKDIFGDALYKIVASGNIIPKSATEIFSPYLFAEPSIFGSSFSKFKYRYFVSDFFGNATEFKSSDLQQEFMDKFHSISIVRTKEQCLNLPPKIFEKVYIDLPEEHRVLYNAMRDDALASYNDRTCSAAVTLTKILRLAQITSGYMPDDKTGEIVEIGKNPKLDRLMDIIEDIPSSEQIVIWTRFRHDIKVIAEELTKAGISHATFFGDTDYEARIKASEDFAAKKVRVFVSNPATGGKGINFLKQATNVIYYTLSFSAEEYQQSQDRTSRMGSERSCLYINLMARDTIDEVILNVLEQNQDFSEAILNRRVSF